MTAPRMHRHVRPRCPRAGAALGMVFLLLGLGVGASGCTPVGAVLGAGAAAGTAAMEDRGFATAVEDTVIQARINAAWLDRDPEMFAKVYTEVHEGRVLLTGAVAKPRDRVEAVRLAWQVEGVREIINEIEVRDKTDLLDAARDLWITSQLRVKITFDKRIKAINYSIDTVNGTVYLMGIARSRQELDRVVGHARGLSYVRRVVSYVRLKEAPAAVPAGASS